MERNKNGRPRREKTDAGERISRACRQVDQFFPFAHLSTKKCFCFITLMASLIASCS